jgi:esterase/lipase
MFYRKAVLIIHGFAGGTYDEELLFFHLQPYLEFDVYNFTLPGHSTNLDTISSYQDWLNSVDDKIETLIAKGYKKIYVIGHSMGGVLASHCAIKYDQVKKLVLVAPAFQYLSMDNGHTLTKAIKYGPDLIKTYEAREVVSRLLKVSVNQLHEFTELVNVSQKNPGLIKTPTLIIQGLDDNVVPPANSSKIFKEMKCNKWLIKVTGVNHDVFRSDRVNEVNKEITKFLKCKKYNAESIRTW